jgi:uncharacterized damage-inducible protein DinB
MAMPELERIVAEIRSSFDSKAWYGPSLLESLQGVDAASAAAHPIPGAHSIWEQVNHILYTQRILLKRINGDPARWNHAEDWPPVTDPSATAWQQTITALKQAEQELETAIARFPESRLEQPLGADGTSAYRNFQGHAQHNAYHAGQIMLLRRAGGYSLRV